MRAKSIIPQLIFVFGLSTLVAPIAYAQETQPSNAELLEALKASTETIAKATAGIDKAVAAAASATQAASQAAKAAGEAATAAGKAAESAAAAAQYAASIADSNATREVSLEASFPDDEEEDDQAALDAILNPTAEAATDDADDDAAAAAILNPGSAARAATPGQVPDLGFKAWLKERQTYYEIPEFDQEPDVTVGELKLAYETLATKAEELANLGATDQALLKLIAAKHKAAIDPILDKKPGRREDWERVFKDLQPQLQTLINNDEFDAGDIRYFVKMAKELAEGFGELEPIFKQFRDLTEEERAAMGSGGGGGGGTAASITGSSFSHGSVWHAHRMNQIRRVHERRMARIRGR